MTGVAFHHPSQLGSVLFKSSSCHGPKSKPAASAAAGRVGGEEAKEALAAGRGTTVLLRALSCAEASAASPAGFLEEAMSRSEGLLPSGQGSLRLLSPSFKCERKGFDVGAPLPFRTKALRVPVPCLSLRSSVNLSKGHHISEPHFFICKAGM